MARKTKRNDTKNGTMPLDRILQSDTARGVMGIFLVAIAAFLALAAFEIGGAVGGIVYSWLAKLLGVGYALLPVSVLLVAFVLFKSSDSEHASPVRIVASTLFFVAALGIVNIAFSGGAGLVGRGITDPLISAVGIPAAVIFLLAFIVASLLLVFDVHPRAVVAFIAEKISRVDAREQEEEDIDIHVPDAEDTEEDEEKDGEEGEEEKPTKKFWERAGVEEHSAIPVITAIGGTYTPPPLSLLGKNRGRPGVGDIKANANIIKRTLQNFGIQVEMDEVSIGPTVTRYAMKPAEGVRLAKILSLQSNLELALAASPVRIEAPIPGQALVGIEVPNTARTTLGLWPLLADKAFSSSDKPLLVALGRAISGAPQYTDIARMPHMLIAGATGAGKSVTIHDLIVSLLYRRGPDQLRFIMVDPKRVELTPYNSIPHLLTPVITDAKKTIMGLKWLAKEMDRRYDVLEAEKVRDIASYHANVLEPALKRGVQGDGAPEPMPYIVVVIDELADIMQAYPRELEASVVRLAQMSRAVGIHLVLSTQRPSVKVITGLIKANIPARVALQVASQVDSRTILDMGGAEKLLGAGDMLFLSGEMSKPKRLQAPYITEGEVKAIVKHIATSYEGTLPDEIDFGGENSHAGGAGALFSSTFDDEEDDELYTEARQAVTDAGKASTSYLQRKLRIGYARAARLMDILEENGVIGPADGSKPREVLTSERESADNSADKEEEVVEDSDGYEEEEDDYGRA